MAHPYEANGAIYDDFRAITVGTSLSGRTSTSGHTWTVYQGTWEIQDGTGFGGTDDGNVATSIAPATYGRAGIDFGSAECDVEATLERPIELVLSGGVMVRRTGSGFYAIRAGDDDVTISRITNADVPTDLAVYTGLTIADASVVRAVCSGNDITAYLDGVELGTVTDATYAGTVHGLFQRFSGNDSWRFYAFNMHPPTRPSGIVVGSIV